jgi:hypothetical protein
MQVFSLDGVSLFSPLGDTGGVAVVLNGIAYLSVVSPSSDFGTNLDYPFLTVTMDVPNSAATGATFPLALLPDATFQTPNGPLTLTDPKPGTLTIGGSVSVHNVSPGGGTWPAGTVISVQGAGFQPGTKISAKIKINPAVYVSATTMDSQPIQVTNPDGSQVTYYAYLRGISVHTPSRSLLLNTEPVFPTITHTSAVVGPLAAMSTGQFSALAVQNPSVGSVVVTFRLRSTGATSSILLPPGGRVMDDLCSLLGGAALSEGDIVDITASSGVQMVGINGDENMNTVNAFLPSF